MNACHIVGASRFKTKPTVSEGDLLIAADGGYDTLLSFGLAPDLLVGDLDSIKTPPKGIESLRFPEKKDETDMYLAYLEGKKRGFDTFKIYGGTGGRADHTFANYCLLVKIRDDGGRAELIGDSDYVFAIKNEKVRIAGDEGKYFSVFAFGRVARGVSITGAEYETDGITLSPDFPLGVSNKFKSHPVEIEVKDGTLLVMAEK